MERGPEAPDGVVCNATEPVQQIVGLATEAEFKAPVPAHAQTWHQEKYGQNVVTTPLEDAFNRMKRTRAGQQIQTVWHKMPGKQTARHNN